MEPAHFLVHLASAVAYRGDKNVTFQQMAAAESAFAVAAVRVDGNTRALEGYRHRLGRSSVDHIFMDAADNGDLECLGLCSLGISGQS